MMMSLMKRNLFLAIPFSLAMGLLSSCSSVENSVEKDETNNVAGDVYSSECLDTRSGEEDYEAPIPLIVLSKQGDILSCELLNFEYTCGPANSFDAISNMSPSSNGMDTLSVVCMRPVGGIRARCLCHFNIHFVMRDVKADTLWFKCRVPNYGYDDFEGEVRLNADSSVVVRPQKCLFDSCNQNNVKQDYWGRFFDKRKAHTPHGMAQGGVWEDVAYPVEKYYD